MFRWERRTLHFDIERIEKDAEGYLRQFSEKGMREETRARWRSLGHDLKTAKDQALQPRALVLATRELTLVGGQAFILGRRFTCPAFAQIDPDHVSGALLYAACAGNFEMPEEAGEEAILYMDLWGNACLEAVRGQLIERLQSQTALSDSFGPGYYGMSMETMDQLVTLLGAGDIGMHSAKEGGLRPAKSCAGFYFSVDGDYRPLRAQCAACSGAAGGCAVCRFRMDPRPH